VSSNEHTIGTYDSGGVAFTKNFNFDIDNGVNRPSDHMTFAVKAPA